MEKNFSQLRRIVSFLKNTKKKFAKKKVQRINLKFYTQIFLEKKFFVKKNQVKFFSKPKIH